MDNDFSDAMGEAHDRFMRSNNLAAENATLRADNARLTAELAEWHNAGQEGHPSPCTLGPLCPYCEIERLKGRLAANALTVKWSDYNIRESVAEEIIKAGLVTGHGDTVIDLVRELLVQTLEAKHQFAASKAREKELTAERDAAVKDAGRYRWITSGNFGLDEDKGHAFVYISLKPEGEEKADLDDEIDREIEADERTRKLVEDRAAIDEAMK